MTIEARIEVDTKNFARDINREIIRILISRMPSIVKNIKSRLSPEVAAALRTSPVYNQLVSGGRLLGELGLPNPSDIDDIIEAWAENIGVSYNKSKGKFGAIEIGIIEDSYADVLSLPQASFIYSSKFGPKSIDWLRWLLLEGQSVIVQGYVFEDSNKGRTGLGIMTKSQGGWSVPARFAGDADDNFATRSLQDIEKVIDDIVRQEITKGLK